MKLKVHKIGDKRIVKRFTLFPRQIQDDKRWLETVYIIQVWDALGYDGECWFDTKFTTEEKYIQYKKTGIID